RPWSRSISMTAAGASRAFPGASSIGSPSVTVKPPSGCGSKTSGGVSCTAASGGPDTIKRTAAGPDLVRPGGSIRCGASVDDLDRAAGGSDLVGGGLAELLGPDGQGLGQVAVAEDLHAVVVPALDQAPGPQGGLVDGGAGVEEGLDQLEVEDGEVLLEPAVGEAAGGHAADQGHLAALGQRVLLEALARRVALVALGARLAVARADP